MLEKLYFEWNVEGTGSKDLEFRFAQALFFHNLDSHHTFTCWMSKWSNLKPPALRFVCFGTFRRGPVSISAINTLSQKFLIIISFGNVTINDGVFSQNNIQHCTPQTNRYSFIDDREQVPKSFHIVVFILVADLVNTKHPNWLRFNWVELCSSWCWANVQIA